MRYQTGIRPAIRSQVLEKKAQFRGSKFAIFELQAFWKENLLKALLCRERACLPPLPGRRGETQRVVNSGVGIDRVVSERRERLLVSLDLGIHTSKLLRVHIRSQLSIDEQIDDSLPAVAGCANPFFDRGFVRASGGCEVAPRVGSDVLEERQVAGVNTQTVAVVDECGIELSARIDRPPHPVFRHL